MSELYSVAAERAVLGFCVAGGAAAVVDVQAAGLQVVEFHRAGHGALWSWLCERVEVGLSVDTAALVEAAVVGGRVAELGGIVYLSGLADDPPLLVAESVAQVRSLALMRRLGAFGRRCVSLSSAPLRGRVAVSAAERLAVASAELLEVEGAGAGSRSGSSADDGAADLVASLDDESEDYSPTGLRDLDRVVDGLGAGELWVLAGRSSMGKSVGAITLMLSAARQGARVAMASLEMPAREQHARCVSQICGVPYRDMSPKGRRRLDARARAAIRRGAAEYSVLPIHIADQGIYTLADIASYARRQAIAARGTSSPLRGLVVDYLGLMQAGPGERRHEAAGRWVAGLKQLAKELGIWVLALNQINRAAEGLIDSVPRISNLSDSTMIENTADVVLLCYRRHYYDPTAPAGETAWIIGKQRGGERNVSVRLGWCGPTGRHFDI